MGIVLILAQKWSDSFFYMESCVLFLKSMILNFMAGWVVGVKVHIFVKNISRMEEYMEILLAFLLPRWTRELDTI